MASTKSHEMRLATHTFLVLHKDDNVLICTTDVPSGAVVSIDGSDFRIHSPIQLGHKIARWPLRTGDKVLRSGMVIGEMTSDAMPGEHVHRHNLRSIYIPSHDRDSVHL